MKHSLNRSQRLFTKNLGSLVYKQVRKYLPQLKEPVYAAENNYQRTGSAIVLQPDAAYYKVYPDNNGSIFRHHSFSAYRRLAIQYYGEGASAN